MHPRKNKHYNDIFLLCLILILSILAYIVFGKKSDDHAPVISEQITSPADNIPPSDVKTGEPEAVPVLPQAEAEPLSDSTLPESFNIKVPFTSQAPLYLWDALHEDACEEASILMFWHWKNGTDFASSQEADNQIKDLVEYENRLGYGLSINLSELKAIAEDHLDLTGLRVESINSPDDIKSRIANGSPVVVGAAGKILPNPNFRNGGPNYHMLLIKGYDQKGFVTNDPGTRKGENYYYTNDELFKAIHDWDSANILNGERNMLFWQKQ